MLFWLRGLSAERSFREVQLIVLDLQSLSVCVVMKEVSNSDWCVRLSGGDLGAFTSTNNKNMTTQFECTSTSSTSLRVRPHTCRMQVRRARRSRIFVRGFPSSLLSMSVCCSENIFHVCGLLVSSPDVSFWAVLPSSFFGSDVNTKGTAWFRCLLVLDGAFEKQEWTLMRSTRETTGVSKDHEMKNGKTIFHDVSWQTRRSERLEVLVRTGQDLEFKVWTEVRVEGTRRRPQKCVCAGADLHRERRSEGSCTQVRCRRLGEEEEQRTCWTRTNMMRSSELQAKHREEWTPH